MRHVLIAVSALAVLIGTVANAVAAPTVPIILTDVSHALDRNILVISGFIENRGPTVTGLVIDAVGYSARGDEVVAGSDGIPWKVPSGGVERFTVALVVRDRLIRDYVVRVAYARPPYAAIASTRRGVDLALYRSLILSRVQVRAELLDGWLFVRSQTDGLPIAQVAVEVTVLLPHKKFFALQTITLTVPADGTANAFLGVADAVLVSVRVTEVLLKTAWSD